MKTKQKIVDDFIYIKFRRHTASIYFIRKSIFTALKDNIKYLKGKLLDIGCGKMPYKNYILDNSEVTTYLGIDIDTAIVYDSNVKPDIIWDGKNIPEGSNCFDSILATEVLEHCPEPEVIFKEAFRVLRDGGVMFITTPFVFPLHESPHDEYRLTPYSIERMAKNSGFKHVDIFPLGGVNAVLAQVIFSYKNKYIKLFLIPLIYLLIKFDKKTEIFKDGVLFTGICAILKK
ncbi:MAG: class I SAM-dependent methyltransferase [Patescibacteria group bacterium]|nr:class I SAM-dependent methyltransferase [Patescibacteria group bacterium]